MEKRETSIDLRKRAMTVTRAVVARMISTVWSPLAVCVLTNLSSCTQIGN